MPAPILYFVRHGETDWNAEARLQGQRDVPLNAKGRAQARRCAALLRDLVARAGGRLDAFTFVSSPLSRANETMEIVRADLGLPSEPPHQTDARLVELSFGRWEGLTFPEVRAADAAMLADRERDLWNFRPPGGESYADLLARVSDWHGGLSRCPAIVVAHGGVARALMVHFGVMAKDDATRGRVDQGVVYAFSGTQMARHA